MSEFKSLLKTNDFITVQNKLKQIVRNFIGGIQNDRLL